MRTRKVDSAGTFHYVTDGVTPGSDVLKDGAAVYTPGVSERRGTTSKYFQGDHLGSTRAITNSSQTQTDTWIYDAFGRVMTRTGTSVAPFQFVGGAQYQSDADSGLMLLGHRYYDSETGRFISPDPIGDGDNWYAYCENNPFSWVDPEGLQAHAASMGGVALGGTLLIPGAGEVVIGVTALVGVGYLIYKGYEYLTSPGWMPPVSAGDLYRKPVTPPWNAERNPFDNSFLRPPVMPSKNTGPPGDPRSKNPGRPKNPSPGRRPKDEYTRRSQKDPPLNPQDLMTKGDKQRESAQRLASELLQTLMEMYGRGP